MVGINLDTLRTILRLKVESNKPELLRKKIKGVAACIENLIHLELNPKPLDASYTLNSRIKFLREFHSNSNPQSNIDIKERKQSEDIVNIVQDFLSIGDSGVKPRLGKIKELSVIILTAKLIDLILGSEIKNRFTLDTVKTITENLILQSKAGIQMLFEKLDLSVIPEQSSKIIELLAKQSFNINDDRLASLEQVLIENKTNANMHQLIAQILNASKANFSLKKENSQLIKMLLELKFDDLLIEILAKTKAIDPNPNLIKKIGERLRESLNSRFPNDPLRFLSIVSKIKFKDRKEFEGSQIENILCNLINQENISDGQFSEQIQSKLQCFALLIIFDLPNISQEIFTALKKAYITTSSRELKDILRAIAQKHDKVLGEQYYNEKQFDIEDLETMKINPNQYLNRINNFVFLLESKDTLHKSIYSGSLKLIDLNQRLRLEIDLANKFKTTGLCREETITKFYEVLADLFQHCLDIDDGKHLMPIIQPIIQKADPLLIKILLDQILEASPQDDVFKDSKPIDLLDYICRLEGQNCNILRNFDNEYPDYFENAEKRNAANIFLNSRENRRVYSYLAKYLKKQLAVNI